MTSNKTWAFVTLCLLSGSPAPGVAATLTVDADCTLIDAVQAAETDSPVNACPAGDDADTIALSADVVLTEPLLDRQGPTALPVITSTVTIQGNGFTIRRANDAPRFRLFYVDGGDLTLEGLTLANGSLDGEDGENGENGEDGSPGGPGVDGGDATHGGHGGDGEDSGQGGAIYVDDGTLTLRHAQLTGHSARGGDGGRGGNGGRGGDGERAGNGGRGGDGGRGGRGGGGGAIFIRSGEVTIVDSVLAGNAVSGGSGGDGGSGGHGGNSLLASPQTEDDQQPYGHGNGGGFPGSGGGGGSGSTIHNAGGQLILVRSVVSDGDARAGAGADNTPTLNGQDGEHAYPSGSSTGERVIRFVAPAPAGGGGAIINQGELAITDSVFRDNRSDGGTGHPGFISRRIGDGSDGVWGQKGGVGGTGAILNDNGRLTITGSTITGNSANGGTGGEPSGDGGRGGHGAIGYPMDCLMFCSPRPGHLIRTINTTFSANTANGGNGATSGSGGTGGVAVLAGHLPGITVLHTSLVGNTASGGQGGAGDGETGFILSNEFITTISVANSLFTGNAGELCNSSVVMAGPNLADTADCPGIPTGLTGVDPVLADNGGLTPTHALLPDSNARDAADPDLCLEAGGVDQRGWSRDPAVTGECDIGAFEYFPALLFDDGFE